MILAKLFNGAVETFKALGQKPTFTSVMTVVVPQLMGLVNQAIEFWGADAEAKLRDLVVSIDAKTGVDVEALDILRDMTPEGEEEFFDGLGKMVLAYGLTKLKVSGYYQGS